MFSYKTHGTCSTKIDIDLDGYTIQNVKFTGGCNGNLQGICSLVTGMDAREAITRLNNIHCDDKSTSCPDQLAKALQKAIAENISHKKK
jgi:uncharacterized protein (TIGR03905 family)